MFMDRFDGRWRLLLRALLSRECGAQRALDIFQKQHRANPYEPLEHFIETLCQDEVTCPPSATQPLTAKPVVCGFPPVFKQNLLTFIHHLRHLLPQTSLHRLIECIRQDSHPNTLIPSLVAQLERQDDDQEKPLFSVECGKRLKDLAQRLCRGGDAGGWVSCFKMPPSEPATETAGPRLSGEQSQRKRPRSPVDQDSGRDVSQQNKRVKVDLSGDGGGVVELSQREVAPVDVQACSSPELQLPPLVPHDTLPETIKVAVLEFKELIKSNPEWDPSYSSVVKVLNDCDPAQVEVVCSSLDLPNLPEHSLPTLCSSVMELPSDLSFSSASVFIKSLLLEKVLSLSEPASRCLVTSVTSLCSRYPRALCHALFEPVLENKNMGNKQADLLSKVIVGCLDSHYRRHALQLTLKVEWTEAVLSVIHCVLDSKPDIDEDLFTEFTAQLMNQASHFAKSVKFSKMLLTVLTKYSRMVTASHKHTLSNCLSLNETFLKKSLQAALKRIPHS